MRRIAIALTLAGCTAERTDIGETSTAATTASAEESSSSEGGSSSSEGVEPPTIGSYSFCEADEDCPGFRCSDHQFDQTGCPTPPLNPSEPRLDHEKCIANTCVFVGQGAPSWYADMYPDGLLTSVCPTLEGFGTYGWMHKLDPAICMLTATANVCPDGMTPTRWVGSPAIDVVACWWEDLASGPICTGNDLDMCDDGYRCVEQPPDAYRAGLPSVCLSYQ